ncbi:MAG: hypothetical protein OXC11_00380 [Rhodospirillales bacterium]|nr:hypothetical protein [Rhodospirillales bacterium]
MKGRRGDEKPDAGRQRPGLGQPVRPPTVEEALRALRGDQEQGPKVGTKGRRTGTSDSGTGDGAGRTSRPPFLNKGPFRPGRLRLGRTLFVHRWHAAQTLGEWVGNDEVGHRFEHVNHVQSLSEYVWRYGAFAEAPDASGRVPVPGCASLREIIAPVAARGRKHFENAVAYAVLFAGEEQLGRQIGLTTSRDDVARYAAHHPDIPKFTEQLLQLHRAMLDYYGQMRYLTDEECQRYRTGPVPLLSVFHRTRLRPVPGLDGSAAPGETGDAPAQIPEDLTVALRGTFTRNIRNALACRAQVELLRTLRRNSFRSLLKPEQGFSFFERPDPQAQQVVLDDEVLPGKPARIVIEDRALAAMLKSIDEPPMPWLVQKLTAFRMAVSAMITMMPVFIVKNFFRDTFAGFVAGRYWQPPVMGTLSGSLHALRDLRAGRSAPMRDYLLQGGFFSGLVESETDFNTTPVAAGRIRGGVSARRKWSRVVHMLTRPAWIAEAGTRVNQYQRALKAGATKYAAARAARMVSADFANIGASRNWRMYVHTVPFLNAAIQGFDQLYQIFRRRWTPKADRPRRSSDQALHIRKTMRAGWCLTAMAMAVWIYNFSGEDRRAQYHAETDYEKASWVTLYDVVGRTDVRIPIPFQIGAAFMKLPEVALDLVTGADTLAGPKFVWSLIHGNLAVGWIPAVIQPVVEIATNRNFFGDPVVPAYMQYWPPEDQYFARSTPVPYRGVGWLLGVSPLQVQTVVRGWTGHLGNLVVTALDEFIWYLGDNGPKPFPRTLALLTGTYSLRGPGLRTYTRFANEFYEISDWATTQSRSRGDADWTVRQAKRITDRVSRRASDLRQRGDRIRTSRSSRESKEEDLERIYADINGMFRDELTELRELRREWWWERLTPW